MTSLYFLFMVIMDSHIYHYASPMGSSVLCSCLETLTERSLLMLRSSTLALGLLTLTQTLTLTLLVRLSTNTLAIKLIKDLIS